MQMLDKPLSLIVGLGNLFNLRSVLMDLFTAHNVADRIKTHNTDNSFGPLFLLSALNMNE